MRLIALAALLGGCNPCAEALRTVETRYRACERQCIPADMSCRPVCTARVYERVRARCPR